MYEPDTGYFFWLVSEHGRKLGKPIGSGSTSPYFNITFKGEVCRSHTLAWFYMTGEWPPEGKLVDHEDGNPRNNKWKNLRLATYVENMANRKRRQSTLSGAKGVHKDFISDLWKVMIIHDGIKYEYGPFETIEAAHKVHEQESRRIRKEFHRPTELRVQKAMFNNKDVTQAIEEFIKDKTLIHGIYV